MAIKFSHELPDLQREEGLAQAFRAISDRVCSGKLRSDQSYGLILYQPPKRRSTQQNAYYWGVVLEILSGAIGDTPTELHTQHKAEFLSAEYVREDGSLVYLAGSTTSLSTVEFGGFIEQVVAYHARKNPEVYIPSPGELTDADWFTAEENQIANRKDW